MDGENLKFKGKDGTNISYFRWKSHEQVETKGIVLILHGMAEHALRYEEFAKFLNEKGYTVYACDHRGHGKTGLEMDKLGYFGKDGWNLIVNDVYQFVTLIKKENKELPIVLFGHSMGSVLARTCIAEFGQEFSGVIISGTTNGMNGITRKVGLILSRMIARFIGREKVSPFLQLVFFGNYNKKFSDGKTPFEWLTRDKKEIHKYIEDDLCGFICTSGFFVDMMDGINQNIKKRNLQRIPKNLPMFIFSGSMDPVGNFCKDIKKTYNLYKKTAGLNNVHCKLYEGGRHEMLNEINRLDVYEDVYKYLLFFLDQRH